MTGFVGLQLPAEVEARVRYESFGMFERVDSAKRYHMVLDPSFPLGVKLYDFPATPGAIPMTWHERLEIFCPLSGRGTFRIGEHIEQFEATDILLIDNLRLHGIDSFEGARRHGLVVVFYPELIAAPGALPCDTWLLRPFRHLEKGCLRLRSGEPYAADAWGCLSRLVAAHFDETDASCQARQKLALSELLIAFDKAFRNEIVDRGDYESRRERLRRLRPLFEHLAAHLDERFTVPAAARLLRMSQSYFMRFFRAATGLTFTAYVDHLRVGKAHQLLIESDLSLAEIAAETGFCDQCHLSRHVRRRFGMSPGRLRTRDRTLASRTS